MKMTAVTVTPLHHPIRVAEQWATLDLLSNGRVDFAAGRGYDRREYEPFHVSFDDNQGIFEEGLELIRRLWEADERISHHGKHYSFDDVRITPKPVQRPHPPIIIGGMGANRTPSLAATFADEFNVPFASLDTIKTQLERVHQAVDAVGRPTDSMTYSAAFVVCAGRDDAEIGRRAAAIGRELDELRSNSPLVGTPNEIVEQLGPFADIGVQRVYLQLLDLSDLEHLQLFADEVNRQL